MVREEELSNLNNTRKNWKIKNLALRYVKKYYWLLVLGLDNNIYVVKIVDNVKTFKVDIYFVSVITFR